ncbi:MAG: hypothetical protein R6V14_05900 [Halanaerobiales bacterium]
MLRRYLNWVSQKPAWLKILYTAITSILYLFIIGYLLNHFFDIKISYDFKSLLLILAALIFKKMILVYLINTMLRKIKNSS